MTCRKNLVEKINGFSVSNVIRYILKIFVIRFVVLKNYLRLALRLFSHEKCIKASIFNVFYGLCCTLRHNRMRLTP